MFFHSIEVPNILSIKLSTANNKENKKFFAPKNKQPKAKTITTEHAKQLVIPSSIGLRQLNILSPSSSRYFSIGGNILRIAISTLRKIKMSRAILSTRKKIGICSISFSELGMFF